MDAEPNKTCNVCNHQVSYRQWTSCANENCPKVAVTDSTGHFVEGPITSAAAEAAKKEKKK